MKRRQRVRRWLRSALCVSLCAAGPIVAAEPAPTPATQQAAPATALRVSIVEVSGNVQVREDERSLWQPAKAGTDVGQGAEFRTGPHSFVRCTIPPDQTFTLDRLGTVKVMAALREGSKLKTDMLMKYGRAKYSIEAPGIEHESTITSPSSTLAVRGTVVALYDQPPFVPQAVSYTGRAMFRNAQRQVAFGGKGQGRISIDAGKTAAETSLDRSVVDPMFSLARTNSDAQVIATQVARGGLISFDEVANILTVSGGTPIANDAKLSSVLPGSLDFVARWNGPANINLEVFVAIGNPSTLLMSPTGFQPSEFLFPGYGLNQSKSGGQIPFDHRGGTHGGTELAYWNDILPGAVYGVAAVDVSGQKVDVKLNAFLHGQKQDLYYVNGRGALVKAGTDEFTLTAGSFQSAMLFLPSVPVLAETTPTVPSRSDGWSWPEHKGRTTSNNTGGKGGSGGIIIVDGGTGTVVVSGAAPATAARTAPSRDAGAIGHTGRR